MEPDALKHVLVRQIRFFFAKARRKKAVVGLSGGVDSSVVCALLAEALGAKNVLAYYLPYGEDRADEKDVKLVASKSAVKVQTVNIKKIVDAFVSSSACADRVAKGNFMARARMALLYHFAREHGALVVGTGNKTELLLGYFTKHGDGACDLLPIGGLYKTQVRRLAKELGVPKRITDKPPSAGLWKGQTDEGEMGITYDDADRILSALVDAKWSVARAEKEFGKKKVNVVLRRMRSTEHKRTPAAIPVI